MELNICPITFKQAKIFVNKHHRHNVAPQGHKFSIGLETDGQLIGIVTIGRPISRHNDDGLTAEVTRCCVLDGFKNANSKLYSAAWKACKSMGYKRLITYTLQSESGASLRAAGFIVSSYINGNKNGWYGVITAERYPTEDKIKWVLQEK